MEKLRVYVIDEPAPEPRAHLALRHGKLSDGGIIRTYIFDPLGGNGLSFDLLPRKTLVVLKPTQVFVDPLRAAMLEHVVLD